MPEQTRLLLVDDHAVVREGYRRPLETRPDLAIVAEAATAREAMDRFRIHGPDVVMLDLEPARHGRGRGRSGVCSSGTPGHASWCSRCTGSRSSPPRPCGPARWAT